MQLQRTVGNRAVRRLLAGAVQRQAGRDGPTGNRAGLPDNLKAGIESLSGMSMDTIIVHYNSPKPAQLEALAYTQGADIHLGPGQEKHLPHEAWHAVQQAQGRVQATAQLKGVALNDAPALEAEADAMGARATRQGAAARSPGAMPASPSHPGEVPEEAGERRGSPLDFLSPPAVAAQRALATQLSARGAAAPIQRKPPRPNHTGSPNRRKRDPEPSTPSKERAPGLGNKWGGYNKQLKYNNNNTFVQYVPADAATIQEALKSQNILKAVYHRDKAFWISDPTKYTLAGSQGKVKMSYTFTPEGARSLMEDYLICGSGDFEEDNDEPWRGETKHPNHTIWKPNELGAYGVGVRRLQELAENVKSIQAFDAKGKEIKPSAGHR